MKTTKTTNKPATACSAGFSLSDTPKYYLADVPQELRRRVLDLCFKRLWHEGLDLLQQSGIHHYDRDDLINFYSWAPTTLPGDKKTPDSPSATATNPEPPGGTSYTSPQSSVEPSSSSPPDRGCVPQERDQPQHTPPPALLTTDNGLSAVASAKAEQLTTDAAPPPPSTLHLPSSLLHDLRDLITRYVILPDMAAEALALWVVHTYAFTLREVTTYIAVVSPEKRCGKTTLLELLGLLAHEALAAANISPSALFRVIEETQPTLIIDEADTFLQARDGMAGILNAGYRKTNSYVVRVADGKPRPKSNRSVTSPGGTSYTSPQSGSRSATTDN